MHKGKGVAVFIALGVPEGKVLQNLKRRKNGKKKKN